MVRVKVVSVLATALALGGCGQEQASDQQLGSSSAVMYAEDGEVSHYIQEVETPNDIKDQLANYQPTPQEDDDVVFENGLSLAKVILIGKKVWQIVEANKPVVNIAYDYVSAVPEGLSNPRSLEHFSGLNQKSYRMSGKNLYGITVYDVIYTVVHQFGGDYEGEGSYLTTVAILPSKVDVLWGYTVDMKTRALPATNVGSRYKPIAAMGLEMNFNVRTVLRDTTRKVLFHFRGDSAKVVATR